MLNNEKRAKYIVEITMLERAKPVPKEKVEELKGGIGKKMITRMKKESVECPVMEKSVSFVECFTCKNFLRRIKGKVDCAGSPL
jgi:hypothetical protein